MNDPKIPAGTARSPLWPALRKRFLKGKSCFICGGKAKLEAHHIYPFHKYPAMELSESNLIPLCESGKNGANCHLLWGHLGSFLSWNQLVREDVAEWHRKLAMRPR
jgi:hypothetical protein